MAFGNRNRSKSGDLALQRLQKHRRRGFQPRTLPYLQWIYYTTFSRVCQIKSRIFKIFKICAGFSGFSFCSSGSPDPDPVRDCCGGPVSSPVIVVRGPVPRRCQGLRGTGPRATVCWRFFVPFEIWRSRTTETRRYATCRSRSPDLDRAQTTETRRYTVGALSEPVGALCKRADTCMFEIWRSRTTEPRGHSICRSRSPDLDHTELQRRADTP